MAMIEPKPGRYFAAIAFIYGNEPCDWLGAVWRDPEGPWHIDYRFRYYRDEDTSSASRDQKNEYSLTAAPEMPEKEVRALFDQVIAALRAGGFNDRVDVLELHTDDPDTVSRAILAAPWSHPFTPGAKRGKA